MKSAIFDNDSRKIKKVLSPTPNLKFKKRPHNNLTWNLEDMIVAYQEQGILPPMLSPTLPPIDSSFIAANNPSLSPLKSSSITSPTTANPIINDKNIKSENSEKSKIVLPKKKIHKSSRVKYVDKRDDINYPRFLVRFTLPNDELKKIRKKQSRPSTPVVSKAGTPLLSKPSTPTLKQSTPIMRPSTPTGLRKEVASPKKLPLGPKKLLSGSKTTQERLERSPEKEWERINTKAIKPEKQVFKSDDKANEMKDDTVKPKEDFIKLKTHWIKLAKECKFMSNSTEGIISLIIEFDSLISFAISYYFDDKLKVQMKINLSDHYWNNLINEADETINKITKVLEKYTDLKQYLKCLIEILKHFKVFIFKRILEIYHQHETKLEECVKIYKNIEMLHKDIEKSFPNLNDYIKSHFPQTWSKRLSEFNDDQGELILPINKNYYLPIGPYLNLNQFLKIFYNLVYEFIEIYNKLNKEDLLYSLKSGSSA